MAGKLRGALQGAGSPLEDFRESGRRSGCTRAAFWVGLAAFISVLAAPTPEGMTPEGHRVAALALLMAIWWIAGAVPIPVTALLPLPLYPLLGVMSAADVSPSYADQNIFLFMGGLFLATAMQRWELHRRIALHIVLRMGTRPGTLILGFMLATGFLSMWISDTATVMMMMPIGLAVVLHFEHHRELPRGVVRDFGAAVMLGIAYAAVIGGIGTLVGTPPNLVFSGTVGKLFPEAPPVDFGRWMMVGSTVTALFLPACWLYLTRLAFRFPPRAVAGGVEVVRAELARLGPMKGAEKLTLAVFSVTALLWMTRSGFEAGGLSIPGWAQLFPHPSMIHDSTVAMAAAILLFFLPAGEGERLLNWEWARKIPWRVLLLLGGGFALAEGFQRTDLARWIAHQVEFLQGSHPLVLLVAVCFLITFLTEVTSNTATTTVMMPVLGAAAVDLGVNPLLLMMPAAMSASCAFMLPVATPGNAIVFGSGYLDIPTMARAGIWLNLAGVVIIAGVTWFVGMPVFGIDPFSVPPWASPRP